MAYPRHQLSRSVRFINRQTGTDISLASASRVELAAATNGPGTGGFDLTLEAQVGDILEASLKCLVSNAAVAVWFNVATRVSGADVNWVLGTAGTSESAWYCPASVYAMPSAVYNYTVQSGDIDANGKVTVRPYYTGASGTARTLYCTAASGLFQFSLKNIGPADPE